MEKNFTYIICNLNGGKFPDTAALNTFYQKCAPGKRSKQKREKRYRSFLSAFYTLKDFPAEENLPETLWTAGNINKMPNRDHWTYLRKIYYTGVFTCLPNA